MHTGIPMQRSRRRPILFLAATRPSATNMLLLNALEQAGIDAEWLPPRLAKNCVHDNDTVLGRIDVLETLDGVEPGIWELQRLEDAGIRVLNRTAAVLSSHDKLASALLRALDRLNELARGGEVFRTPLVVLPIMWIWSGTPGGHEPNSEAGKAA